MRMFKKNKKSVTLLDEKWNVIESNVDFNNLPRIHELIFLPKENKYYRVVNENNSFLLLFIKKRYSNSNTKQNVKILF
jgi:hypothetical protein